MIRIPSRIPASMRPGTRQSRASYGLEFTKIGARRFDWSDPYHMALTAPWWAFLAGVFGLYLGIVVVFAALFLAEPGSIAGARPGALSDAVFFSLETLATVGYGEMSPADFYGHVVAAIEIVVGVGFTAIMTGLLFVRFSRPRPRILYADTAVICRYNGRRTLTIRIGNPRTSILSQVRVELNALVRETTIEGGRFRRLQPLPLLRPSVPIFPMVLTLMHEIDETSPLHGQTAEILAASDLVLVLSVEARDPDLAATVFDVHSYRATQIRPGMRYVDAVTQGEDGLTVADLTRLSQIEPDPDPDLDPGGA